MKSNLYTRKLMVGGVGLLLLAIGGRSIVLAGGKTATNTLSFTESLQDKEVCNSTAGCQTEQAESYTVKSTVLLTGVNISAFGTNTAFDLNLGHLDVTNSLGDDAKYTPGATKATFVRQELNDAGKTVTYLTVGLKWTAEQLTVSVTGKTPDFFHSNLHSILAEKYDTNATASIMTVTNGVIDFDALSLDFSNITVTGSVVTKPKTAKDGSQVELSTVKLKGSGTGEFVPPAE